MIKIFALAMLVYCVLSFAACGNVSRRLESGSGAAETVCSAAPARETPESAIDAQFTLMPEAPIAPESFIMIDGKLYKSTGQESDIDGRCGMMDGGISSSVAAGELPTENNQSNFGAPYGYQFGPGGVIEVRIGEKWMVFDPVEEE